MRRFNAILLMLFVIAFSKPAYCASLTVPSGTVWRLDNSSMLVQAYDLEIAGTLILSSGAISVRNVTILPGGALIGGSGVIEVSGDWTNNGVFNPGTGQVHFIDGALSSSTLSGSLSFYDLVFRSSVGKTYLLPYSGPIIVSNSLSLSGTASAPIGLESSEAGNTAFIDVSRGVTSSYAVLNGVQINSVTLSPVAVPTLNPVSVFALSLLMFAQALLLHRRQAGNQRRNQSK